MKATSQQELVEDLKTQTTSRMEAFQKYSHFKKTKSHHWSKPAIFFYSFIPPSASYNANTRIAFKKLEDL